MYIFLIVIHIIVCFVLITTILLQAGRGGGLTEAFGGDSMQSILGTQASDFLKKATEVSAILFLLTSLSLGVISSGKGRSLLGRTQYPQMPLSGDFTNVPSGSSMPATGGRGGDVQAGNTVQMPAEVNRVSAEATT
jgi:preprotein translocase subunit SecG